MLRTLVCTAVLLSSLVARAELIRQDEVKPLHDLAVQFLDGQEGEVCFANDPSRGTTHVFFSTMWAGIIGKNYGQIGYYVVPHSLKQVARVLSLPYENKERMDIDVDFKLGGYFDETMYGDLTRDPRTNKRLNEDQKYDLRYEGSTQVSRFNIDTSKSSTRLVSQKVLKTFDDQGTVAHMLELDQIKVFQLNIFPTLAAKNASVKFMWQKLSKKYNALPEDQQNDYGPEFYQDDLAIDQADTLERQSLSSRVGSALTFSFAGHDVKTVNRAFRCFVRTDDSRAALTP